MKKNYYGNYYSGQSTGGLISVGFILWAQIFKNACQITPLSTIHQNRRLLRGVILAPIFGDFSQCEKLFEIKPP